MKKTYALLSIPIIALAFMLMSYSTGSPGGKSGSPGDAGATCTQCHIGTPNPVSDWISTDIPMTGYIPGNTYTLTLTGTHSGVGKFGFEVTAENTTGGKVGTFALADPTQTKFTNNNKAVTHTSSGNTPSGDSKTWTVDWTAPEAGTGAVTFYAAFNAANGNGNNSGDIIYTSNHSVTENPGVGIPELAFADLKVYPNPTYGSTNVSLGEDAEIYIFDISGNLIMKMDAGKGNTMVDLSAHPSGTYFLRVQNEIKSEIRKIIRR
ncbi:MAG TPA: choice-of-anchor V domain-containing protein [Bacteroidales bacterium]|nr:choice-of-anchor V domain-containing protein [Bacteroidales bacterium]